MNMIRSKTLAVDIALENFRIISKLILWTSCSTISQSIAQLKLDVHNQSVHIFALDLSAILNQTNAYS